MPLLDHFHPPLSEERHWDGFHSKWANVLVDELNQTLLPPGYFAEPHRSEAPPSDLSTAVASPSEFAVHVFAKETPPRRVATIQFVSPTGKSVANRHRALAVKCARYVYQGIGLVLIDIVTIEGSDLNDEIFRLVRNAPPPRFFPATTPLYATAYRLIGRGRAKEIQVWAEPLAVGRPLPVLPLALTADLCLPINLETTYTEACHKLRLI